MSQDYDNAIRSLFDQSYYLENNPDVATAGIDPFTHYMQFGWKENRNPSESFDTKYYLDHNSDVAAANINPLEHFVMFGKAEGRLAIPETDVGYSSTLLNLFDKEYYLTNNPDVAVGGIDPFTHYMQFGWKEGRNPSELFNTNYYLETNPDVQNAGVNPLEHYALYGWKENRNPSDSFDTSFYLNDNTDVAAANVNPLEHYMLFGKAEGRQAEASFNIEFDYSVYDNSGFFSLHPERVAVVEEACEIWEGIFADEFENIPAGTVIELVNPTNRKVESLTITQEIDDFRLYLGSYTASDSSLGVSMSLSQSDTGNAELDARYNSYTNIEPWVGSLAFNEAYAGQLYFDPTPSDPYDDKVPENQYDFLHIVMHEMGHALGMGPQNAGSQYVTEISDSSYFAGPNVLDVYGGSVLLDLASGTHFSSSISMEALMKPTLSYGTRVLPTALDKAFFADIGYEVRT